MTTSPTLIKSTTNGVVPEIRSTAAPSGEPIILRQLTNPATSGVPAGGPLIEMQIGGMRVKFNQATLQDLMPSLTAFLNSGLLS